MIVVYAGETAPATYSKSIFLAGPTPRSQETPSWRPQALKILEKSGYDGVVFCPEPKGGGWTIDYMNQVEWEERHLHMSDCILFWVPREMKSMPALTTNCEWGVWQESGKVVFGAPKNAEKVRYLRYYADKHHVPSHYTLAETVSAAMAKVGVGSQRSGGEREVPLQIWNSGQFQEWYRAQKLAGNRLESARTVWTFRVGPHKTLFFWALHVSVFIASEGRCKDNEVVLSRPDISVVVMYRPGTQMLDTEVVCVSEFRSPQLNPHGLVLEMPGGSSFHPHDNALQQAVEECAEETGLTLTPERLKPFAARQMAATLCAHRAHVFSVELTDEEIGRLKQAGGQSYGVAGDSEKTYVEVKTVGEILRTGQMDWAMLGIVMAVLAETASICAPAGESK